jgi:hypothetical protein
VHGRQVGSDGCSVDRGDLAGGRAAGGGGPVLSGVSGLSSRSTPVPASSRIALLAAFLVALEMRRSPRKATATRPTTPRASNNRMSSAASSPHRVAWATGSSTSRTRSVLDPYYSPSLVLGSSGPSPVSRRRASTLPQSVPTRTRGLRQLSVDTVAPSAEHCPWRRTTRRLHSFWALGYLRRGKVAGVDAERPQAGDHICSSRPVERIKPEVGRHQITGGGLDDGEAAFRDRR